MIDFWWNKNKYGYYIVGSYDKRYYDMNGYCIVGSYDKRYYDMNLIDISFLLKIDRNVLCQTLLNNFHGFIPEGTASKVYFENQLDVEEAIQWLETVKISLLLI